MSNDIFDGAAHSSCTRLTPWSWNNSKRNLPCKYSARCKVRRRLSNKYHEQMSHVRCACANVCAAVHVYVRCMVWCLTLLKFPFPLTDTDHCICIEFVYTHCCRTVCNRSFIVLRICAVPVRVIVVIVPEFSILLCEKMSVLNKRSTRKRTAVTYVLSSASSESEADDQPTPKKRSR